MPTVTLSTVHRAKGLEGERIFILQANDLPLTWRNQTQWQRQQEDNLLYVALTRSKSKLYVVGKPAWLIKEEEKTADTTQEEVPAKQYLNAIINSLNFEQKCELLTLLKKEVYEEKAKRVEQALRGEMSNKSNRAIAKELGFVSDVTVAKVRKRLLTEDVISPEGRKRT